MDVPIREDGSCFLGHALGKRAGRRTAPVAAFASPAPAPYVSGSVVPVAVADAPPVSAAPALTLAPTRRRPRRALPAVLALTLVAVGAGVYVLYGPGFGSAAASYRHVFERGETHSYALQMAMTGSIAVAGERVPMDMTMRMDLTETVEQVGADGVATIRYTIDRVRGEALGQPLPLPENIDVSIVARRAPDGRVLSSRISGDFGLSKLLPTGDLFSPEGIPAVLPKGKIAPGDEWVTKTDMQMPFAEDPVVIVVRNRLVRLDTVGGAAVAIIHSTMSVPLKMTLGAAQLRALSGEEGPIPDDAEASFEGTLSFSGTQTIFRDTARTIALDGRGTMDFTVRLAGAGAEAVPEMRFDFDMKVSFDERSGSAAKPPASSGATRTSQDREAQSSLRNGLVAQKVYFVDNGSYASDKAGELAALAAIEPALRWGSVDGGEGGVDVVVPAAPGAESLTVVLRSTSRSGTTFCLADLADGANAGVWYARVTGGGPCPAPIRGMTGWSRDAWKSLDA